MKKIIMLFGLFIIASKTIKTLNTKFNKAGNSTVFGNLVPLFWLIQPLGQKNVWFIRN